MNTYFHPMSQEEADLIVQWHYEPPYDFYDAESDKEDMEELLNFKEDKETSYYTLHKDGELKGFFSFTKKDAVKIDVGLGLNPTMTGRGQGLAFVLAGMELAKEIFDPAALTLSVATFNKRAIKVYERAGFQKVRRFMQETNGSSYEFVEMEKECLS